MAIGLDPRNVNSVVRHAFTIDNKILRAVVSIGRGGHLVDIPMLGAGLQTVDLSGNWLGERDNVSVGQGGRNIIYGLPHIDVGKSYDTAKSDQKKDKRPAKTL